MKLRKFFGDLFKRTKREQVVVRSGPGRQRHWDLPAPSWESHIVCSSKDWKADKLMLCLSPEFEAVLERTGSDCPATAQVYAITGQDRKWVLSFTYWPQHGETVELVTI